MKPLKIIYVLGRGRSGSTFIEHIIAQKCGIAQLGEVRLWPMCYTDTHTCSCGKPKTECEFWKPVMTGLDAPDQVKQAFQTTMKRSFLFSLLMPKFARDRVYKDISEKLALFYRKIGTTHEREIVLDSSKNPAYGAELARTPGLEVTFVHVMRHPLGVVYSWKRQRQKKSDKALYNVRKPLALAALEWTGSNLLCELAKWRSPLKGIYLRYEDLGDINLQDSLHHRMSTMAQTATPLSHVMSGNPGDAWKSATFSLDEEWKTGLSLWEKLLYGAITYPLYIFYAGRQSSV